MSEKLYYTMGEVAEMLDVRQSVIRHWEKEFGVVRPRRNKKGNRLFSGEDVAWLKKIHHLVRERGMKLEGAKKVLKQMLREGRSAGRDTELLERLQRIRAQLLEVREALKARDGELVDDAFAEETLGPEAADCAAPTPAGHNRGAAAQSVDAVPAAGDFVSEQTSEDIPGAIRKSDSEGVAEAVAACDGAVPASQKGRKAVVKIVDETSEEAAGKGEAPKRAPGTVLRRPRRKKEDAENKELFAFYEQSLF